MGGAMGSPEKLAQYNVTTKLGLQSLSHVLTTPLRRPWPRNRPRQPLRGSGVHRSEGRSAPGGIVGRPVRGICRVPVKQEPDIPLFTGRTDDPVFLS